MQSNFTLFYKQPYFFAVLVLCFCFLHASAQTTDSSHLYGITKSGEIYIINTSTGDCGTKINPDYTGANQASESNAMGYDSVNKSLYYFKRNINDAPQQFVSYNLVTKVYTRLKSSPAIGNVYRGCVNNSGTGYYCFDSNSNLLYYDIAADTWTIITANFNDQDDNYVTDVLDSYASGDIAFDGKGNLWILCSDGFQYGLYTINGPLPTTPVDSLITKRLIADTANSPVQDGVPFGGIAFSSKGQIYISAGSIDNRLYLLTNDFTLQLVATMSVDGAGTDLTSDIFPVSQLPVTYLSFDGVLRNNEALLNWSTANERNNKGFEVQRSVDAETFTDIGFVNGSGTSASVNNYSFADAKLVSGNNYYRLKQIDLDGKFSYSSVIKLAFTKFDWSVLGNPSNNMWVQLQLDKMHTVSVQLISLSGTVLQTINKGNIGVGTYSIPLNMNLAPGMYVVRLVVNGNIYSKNVLR